MLKRYQTLLSGLLGLVDAATIIAAWLASYWFRFNVPLVPVTRGFPDFISYASLTPVVAILWLSVFVTQRIYSLGRLPSPAHEVVSLLKAHGLALLLFIAITYLFQQYEYSRLVILYFGALSSARPCSVPQTTKVKLAPCQRPPRTMVTISARIVRAMPWRLPPSGM